MFAVSGSLTEPLLVVPMLLTLSLVGAGMLTSTMRSEARAKSRNGAVYSAQTQLDRMVREMRTASSVEWLTPNPTTTAATNTMLGGMPAIDAANGETNWLIAHDVLLPAVGTDRRDVIYVCYYVWIIPGCASFYSSPLPENRDIANPPAALPVLGTTKIPDNAAVTGLKQRAIFPSSPPDASSVLLATNNNYEYANWAWTDADIGVFQFYKDGAKIDTTAGVDIDADYLEIHISVCLRSFVCGAAPDATRPILLKTGLAPRNYVEQSDAEDGCELDPPVPPPGEECDPP